MICAVAVGAAPETIEPWLLGTMLEARLVSLARLARRTALAGGLLGPGPAALLDPAAQVGQPAADLLGRPGDLRTGQRGRLGGAGDQVGLRGPPGRPDIVTPLVEGSRTCSARRQRSSLADGRHGASPWPGSPG